MKCQYCGNDLKNEAKFCGMCGNVLNNNRVQESSNYQQNQNMMNPSVMNGTRMQPIKQTSTGLIVLIVIIIVGILFTIGTFVTTFFSWGDFFGYEEIDENNDKNEDKSNDKYEVLYGEWIADNNSSLVINKDKTVYLYDTLDKTDNYCKGKAIILAEGVLFADGSRFKDDEGRDLYTLMIYFDECKERGIIKKYGEREYGLDFALGIFKDGDKDTMQVQGISTKTNFTARRK